MAMNFHDMTPQERLEIEKYNKFLIKTFKEMAETLWNNDDTHTPFKMGETVFFKHRLMCGYAKVIGINDTGLDDGREYALKDIPMLMWEKELYVSKEVND